MKYISRLSIAMILFGFTSLLLHAQVTNLTLGGSGSNFTVVTGSTTSWHYNIPNGATAFVELWYDINGNGLIDTATDINYFKFTQTDGDTSGNGNGPPDQDGLVNGSVSFAQGGVGLAPGKYVFRVSQGGTSMSVAGTITQLTSPAHTISGTVTAPSGKSSRYILVDLKQKNGGHDNNRFWDAFTDVNGNYTLQMDADTSGNPWRVTIGQNGSPNPFPPYILSPAEIDIIVSAATYTNNNFAFVSPGAQVLGTVKDENGLPVPGLNIYVNRNDFSGNGVNYNANTDASGHFAFGILSADLNANSWNLGISNCNDCGPETHLSAGVNLGVIHQGDSLVHNFTAYTVNSSISGQFLIDGHAPNFNFEMIAQNDSGQAFTEGDPLTGDFIMPVSDKISSYYFYPNNLSGYFYPYSVTAHPGQTGIIVNYTTNNNVQQYSRALNIGWNLTSVPLLVNDYGKNVLFPTAGTPAFAFQGAYVQKDPVANGYGFWLKYHSADPVSMNGYSVSYLTVKVNAGWNIIGSLSTPIAIANIGSLQGNMTISVPYEFDPGGYVHADSIRPGYGYWVKTNEAGQLILSSPSNGIAPVNHVRIAQTFDQPPPPPDGPIVAANQVSPKEYRLGQNYPNPFNPTTDISYQLPEESFVRLSIYNILGQEVRTLVNQTEQPGYKSVRFDASTMPSGIYIYRLTAGTFTDIKKMIILK